MAEEQKKSDIAIFQKAARDNGMTYGQLQVLETCGEVIVTPNGQLLWRK